MLRERAVRRPSANRSRWRRVARLLWQRLAGLLVDDVFRIPIRPVLIVLAGPFLVLAVRSRRALQRSRKIGDRREGRVRLHTAGKPCGHLLEQPAVAVRIAKRGQGKVTATLWIRTADPNASKQVRLVGAGVHIPTVKRLADLHATAE